MAASQPRLKAAAKLAFSAAVRGGVGVGLGEGPDSEATKAGLGPAAGGVPSSALETGDQNSGNARMSNRTRHVHIVRLRAVDGFAAFKHALPAEGGLIALAGLRRF